MPTGEVVGTVTELWSKFVEYCNNLGISTSNLPTLTTPQEIVEYINTYTNIKLEPLYKTVTTLEQTGWTWVYNAPVNPAETTDMVVRGVTDLTVVGGAATSITSGRGVFGTITRKAAAAVAIAVLGISMWAAQIGEQIKEFAEGFWTDWTVDGKDAVPVLIDENGKTYLDERAIQKFREGLANLGVFDAGFVPSTTEYAIGDTVNLQALSLNDAITLLKQHIQASYVRNPTDIEPSNAYFTYEQQMLILDKWIELNNTLPGTTYTFTYGQLGTMEAEVLAPPNNIYGFVMRETGMGSAPTRPAYTYVPVSASSFQVSSNPNNVNGASSDNYINLYGYTANVDIFLGPNAVSANSSTVSELKGTYTSNNHLTQLRYLYKLPGDNNRAVEFYFPTRVIAITGTHYEGAQGVSFSSIYSTQFAMNGHYLTMRGFGYSNRGIVFDGTLAPGVPGFTPTNPTVGDLTKSITELYPDWVANGIELPSPTDDDLSNTGTWLPVSITETDPLEQDHVATSDDQEGDTNEDTQQSILDKLQELIQTIAQYQAQTDDEVITPTIPVEDSGDTPPATPTVISGASNGLWTIYNPTLSEVQQFGAWLWSDSIIDQIKRQFASPIDGVIGFLSIYCTPITGDRKMIKAGYLTSPVSAKEVTNQYVTINCGQVAVPEYYHSAIDYTRSKVDIFLPFIGIVPLDCSVVTGSTLEVIYRIDVLTGTCLAQIKVIKQNSDAVMYTYNGNCGVQLPLTSGTYTGLVSTLSSMCSGAISAMTGNMVGVGASLMGMATSMGTYIQKSGVLASNAGALGIRIPYLIITHPTAYDAMIYNQFYGYPSNVYQRLSAMSGFVRVKDIHMDSVTCTDQELEMIYAKLKEGVIIS